MLVYMVSGVRSVPESVVPSRDLGVGEEGGGGANSDLKLSSEKTSGFSVSIV